MLIIIEREKFNLVFNTEAIHHICHADDNNYALVLTDNSTYFITKFEKDNLIESMIESMYKNNELVCL